MPCVACRRSGTLVGLASLWKARARLPLEGSTRTRVRRKPRSPHAKFQMSLSPDSLSLHSLQLGVTLVLVGPMLKQGQKESGRFPKVCSESQTTQGPFQKTQGLMVALTWLSY